MKPVPKSIPFGRIGDLRSRPDANLIAIKAGRSWDSEYSVKRYASRLQLESFLKRSPGAWKAIVKTTVDKGMMIYPAFQLETPYDKEAQ